MKSLPHEPISVAIVKAKDEIFVSFRFVPDGIISLKLLEVIVEMWVRESLLEEGLVTVEYGVGDSNG
jgi:hypothetical protein